MIQALIDSTPNHTAILPAGVYHIGSPLRVGCHGDCRLSGGGYLVGAGADRTFIFALNESMSMVVGAGAGQSYHFHVGGLTMAGGRYGIHWAAETAGPHMQVTESVLSHILFANLSVGIFADDIYGVPAPPNKYRLPLSLSLSLSLSECCLYVRWSRWTTIFFQT